MVGVKERRAYGQFVPGIPEVWMPDTTPIPPERRLLVPEPEVRFDKLTPEQMGSVHGRIAERPPVSVLHRLNSLRFDPDTKLYLRDKKLVIEGKEYAEAYAENIRKWLSDRGATDQDLMRFNPGLLIDPVNLSAYINGMERVNHGQNRFIFPDGYPLGFAVGITKDFNLPVSFTGVPTNSYEYNAFMDGLAGVEIPRELGSLAGRIPELRSFQLGNRIHEIVEAEPVA